MKQPGIFNSLGTIAAVYAALVMLVACSNPSGEFFYGALGLGDRKLLVASGSPGALTVVMYDLNGEFIDVIADYTYTNDVPRGLAPFDGFNVMVFLDGIDRLSKLSLKDGSSLDYTNTGVTGNLYHLTYDSVAQRYYGIETSTIEAFSRDGTRIGNPFIAATLGGCVQNVGRGIAASHDGRLFAVNTGNDDLNVYDVSDTAATCISGNTTMGNVDPVAVMLHSNGLVYVATQGDDRIYSFPNDAVGAGTVVWETDLLTISNPTSLLELPDGTILISSDLTNSIERITPAGARVGSTSFIKDAFTGAVTQMLLIGGE